MLKRINDVLPELILEIFLYGLLVQLTGVWFVENKLLYSTGLWIGIAAAMVKGFILFGCQFYMS